MSFAPLRAAFYLYTSGSIVAGGAGLLTHHGLPQAVTGALLAGYLGFLALGVAEPRSRIFGDVISRVPEGFALTFDDGPHPENTRRIMDLLEARGAKGTFFMIARKMEKYPDVVREVIARGHAIGAHSYAHDRMYAMRSSKWLAQDADREEKVWEDVVGALPVLYRPPIGLMNPRIAAMAYERERVTVAWTVRPRDGVARTPAELVQRRVIAGLREGAIVLLHDTPEDGDRAPTALAALPAILDAAARLGVSARTVSAGGLALPDSPRIEGPPS